jgi:hypothetical protein
MKIARIDIMVRIDDNTGCLNELKWAAISGHSQRTVKSACMITSVLN